MNKIHKICLLVLLPVVFPVAALFWFAWKSAHPRRYSKIKEYDG